MQDKTRVIYNTSCFAVVMRRGERTWWLVSLCSRRGRRSDCEDIGIGGQYCWSDIELAGAERYDIRCFTKKESVFVGKGTVQASDWGQNRSEGKLLYGLSCSAASVCFSVTQTASSEGWIRNIGESRGFYQLLSFIVGYIPCLVSRFNLVHQDVNADIANPMLAHYDKRWEDAAGIQSLSMAWNLVAIGYHAVSVLADMIKGRKPVLI